MTVSDRGLTDFASGAGLEHALSAAVSSLNGATICVHCIPDASRYGVVEFDRDGGTLSIEEKPAVPKSNWAITGMYFFDQGIAEHASGLEPSARGELEITDLIKCYQQEGRLQVERLGSDIVWIDSGTPEALLKAASWIRAVEEREGRMISCPEEIAWRLGYIDDM